MFEFVVSVIFITIIIGIYLIFFYKWQKKLQKNRIDYYKNLVSKTDKSQISLKEKIITFDKIYHNILKESGYKWSFWEILKKKPSVIWDINKIWELHKARNMLVHEIVTSDEKKLSKQSINYKEEVLVLLRKLS